MMLEEVQDYIEIIKTLSRPLQPVPTGLITKNDLTTPVKAVLFDVYGTLFISGSGDVGSAMESSRPEVFRESLQKYGVQFLQPEAAESGVGFFFSSIEESHARLRDGGVDFPEVDICKIWMSVFRKLYGKGLIERIPDVTVQKQIAVEYECRTNPVWPMPGAHELLMYLGGNNIPMGIVSNAQFFTPCLFPAFFDKSISAIGFDEDCCIWSWEYGHGKPSTLLHQKAMNALDAKYGVNPEETLYVGNDMLNDIYTAHSAGLKTVLYGGDQRSLRWRDDDSRCNFIRPNVIIDDLRQLRNLIKETTL